MTNLLQVAQGGFRLNRFPRIKNDNLRAWDAADEYLLNYFNETFATAKALKILLVNDSFGALAVVLAAAGHRVSVWSDSVLSEQGITANFKLNKAEQGAYQFYKSTQTPPQDFDLVLFKIPKSHGLLEDQLYRLLSVLKPETRLFAAAMAKNIHSSTLNYFTDIIGVSTTSLAVKKARLVFTATDQLDLTKQTPYPKSYDFDGFGYKITNHANVFSREKLDIGTRFFLQYMPRSEKYKTIIDMGCGNGLLGLAAAEKNPSASVIFADESFMAIESAKINNSSSSRDNHVKFFNMDCLHDLADNSADLVLNNPPFHQQHATGDAVAWRMFVDAKRVLKKGGELWVVANRHLAYHSKLKKIFNHCELVADNKKFVILKACK
ncbi:MAG: methyltransferase [Gammaproteobacteria bacterium]|nr:methyltransferase [Gammaproteobacteria bacterium]